MVKLTLCMKFLNFFLSLTIPLPPTEKESCSYAVFLSLFLLGNIFGIRREQVYLHSPFPVFSAEVILEVSGKTTKKRERAFREKLSFLRAISEAQLSSPSVSQPPRLILTYNKFARRVRLFPFSQKSGQNFLSRVNLVRIRAIKQDLTETAQASIGALTTGNG